MLKKNCVNNVLSWKLDLQYGSVLLLDWSSWSGFLCWLDTTVTDGQHSLHWCSRWRSHWPHSLFRCIFCSGDCTDSDDGLLTSVAVRFVTSSNISSIYPRGMQSSVFLCLSQDQINWDGWGRKGFQHKMGEGIDGGGLLISLDGVAPTRIVGVSASCCPP